MFTVLSNTRNFNLYLIAALAIMMVVLLTFAVAPAISAPKSVLVPITGSSESTSDYFQRHSELSAASKSADLSWPPRPVIIPVTRANAFSDYFQRHPNLNALAGEGIAIDMTDFFVRHPELRAPAESIDRSDYFLRH